MKDKLVKGKKQRIKWNDLIFAFENPYMEAKFYEYFGKHKNISRNRVAYNFLKTYYSTTLMRRIRTSYENYGLTYQELVKWIHWENPYVMH